MRSRDVVRAVARRVLRRRPAPSDIDLLRAEGVVTVGVGTYGVEGLRVHDFRLPDRTWLGARLCIGKYCSIAPCDVFLAGNHHYERRSQYPFATMWDRSERVDDGYGHGDVIIGNDVWIGHASTIMSGVTIGDGAVVGTRAVVTRDVPPYAIVAGNPAQVVKRRFSDATIAHLLQDPWWDWPEERLRASFDFLMSRPDES